MKLNTNLLLQKQHSNLDQASPDEKNIAKKKSIPSIINNPCFRQQKFRMFFFVQSEYKAENFSMSVQLKKNQAFRIPIELKCLSVALNIQSIV